jgi:hypothetical protein
MVSFKVCERRFDDASDKIFSTIVDTAIRYYSIAGLRFRSAPIPAGEEENPEAGGEPPDT